MGHPIEVLPAGWETRRVWFRHRDGREENRFEIINTNTNIRYQHEPLTTISGKCMAVFFGGQIYGLVYVFWHFLRAPLVAVSVVFQAVKETLSHPSLRQIQRIFSAIFYRAPLLFIQNICAALRAPFYALKLELIGLYGNWRPLEGRVLIAELEKSWHHRTRRDNWDHTQGTIAQKIWRGLIDPENKQTFFLAYCMQPIGKLSDRNVIRSEVQSVTE